jgi:HEAT repeat protein
VVQAPPPVVVANDPVATEIVRLSSRHESSRRDAVANLGRMHDARAVSAIVDRLKNDHSKDVRVAAANALGEIGDPGASLYLERSVVYDHKQEVRDAASAALARMPRPSPAPVASAGATSTPSVLRLEPAERVPPPPIPASPAP